MLDEEHDSMEETFDALAAMVREVTKFSRDHRADIRAQVEDMQSIVGTMVEKRRGLERLLETIPLMMQNVEPGHRRERPDQLPHPARRPPPGHRGVPGAVLELPAGDV